MNEIYNNKEGLDKLISGINKAEYVVSSTFGPNGKTVIIPDNKTYDKYKVTKDGVSVINSIELSDPVENIGVELLRQAANKTVDEAGDGTTTATILATAFVNNLKDFNHVEVNKAFDEIIPKVIEQLKVNSKRLKHEDIKYVANISANNDTEIGDIIQKAHDFSPIVKVEESTNTKDEIELIEGMSLKVSYFSKEFVNNQRKGECVFDEPNILILDGKLESLQPFEEPIKLIAKNKEPLLIIVEDIHESVLNLLISNVLNNSINVCVIKAPGFSKHRKDLLKDIGNFTGATVISNYKQNYNSNIIGKLKSCKITKNNSILLKHDSIDISKNILDLEENIKATDLEQHDIDLLKQRIENLKSKISIIKVGGKTEIEMKERFDRYDDAVKAVACALEEGIVEGGGIAFQRILFSDYFYLSELNVKNLNDAILISLVEPLNKIRKNGAIINENVPSGMFKQNIIDPLKVTRCALENAVSVAKTILSTNAVVLNKNQWKNN